MSIMRSRRTKERSMNCNSETQPLSLQHFHQLVEISPVHHEHISAVRADSDLAVCTCKPHTAVLELARLAREWMIIILRWRETVVIRETIHLVRLQRRRRQNCTWRDSLQLVVDHREVIRLAFGGVDQVTSRDVVLLRCGRVRLLLLLLLPAQSSLRRS